MNTIDFITGIGFVSSVITIIGAPLVLWGIWQLFLNYKEAKRLNQIVSVVLQCTEDNRKIVPLMVVRRKDITRAELQGILGTIKMKPSITGRYKLDHLNTKKFWQDIERLQASDNDDNDQLLIPCSPDEIEQFDV
ncbi:MAG: hypothetical protein HGB23_10980 [Chlorobiaceae bacterium]|nr:hypothetical protein [Chlorobiaceae bacterium]